MKYLIYFFISYIFFKFILKLFSKFKVYEKIEYIENDVIITKKYFFYIKTDLININNIKNVIIHSLNVHIINFNLKINDIKVNIKENEKEIKLFNKNNIFLILKLIKKYNEYLFQSILSSEVFNMPGLKKTLEEELEKINV